jgi:hypothetical protein
MCVPLLLLLLLCSCGSSSVPDGPSSAREKKEEKAVNNLGEHATSKASDNGSAISKPTPEQKNISSVVNQRAEGQHSVLTHTATTPMEQRPGLDVPQGISLVSVKESCAEPTHPMSSTAQEGCSSSTHPVAAPNAAGVSVSDNHAELTEVLTPQELLQAKLNTPNRALSTTQSISLIEHCAQLGEQNAVSATDKDAIAILGRTGAGKSTYINSWTGCQMVLRTPEELGIRGVNDVIVVSPDSVQPEVTSIGHGMVSHTFMPKIIQDPHDDTRVYLDCPGFDDTRGAEINIANAINTKRVLQQAQGVKAVFLAGYNGLFDDRGGSIRDMETMCSQMFGGIDNLRNHQNSVLLGINRAPLQTRLDRMRTWCAEMDSPIMQILANRLFLYDPLEQGRDNPDFWSREQFLAAIGQMPCIPQEIANNMFQTTLTDSDKTALQRIVRHQVDNLRSELEQSDYPAASRCWNLLKRLRIIGHGETAERMEKQAITHMRAYAAERTATFNDYAAQHNFTEAERLLASLRVLNEHFPEENLVNLDNLNATLNTAQAQHTAQLEAEEEARRNAEEALRNGEEARSNAEEARRNAEEARSNAEEALRNAEEARRAEEEARKNREAFERERSAKEDLAQRNNNLERALEEEKAKAMHSNQ